MTALPFHKRPPGIPGRDLPAVLMIAISTKQPQAWGGTVMLQCKNAAWMLQSSTPRRAGSRG